MDYTLDLGAILISIFTLAWTLYKEYQERIKAKKAVLVPEFIRQPIHEIWAPQPPGYETPQRINDVPFLKIINFGQGIARNIKVLVDDKELKVLINKYPGPDVIPYIAPGAHFSIMYNGIADEIYNHNVTIIWSDDFNEYNRIVSTVSFA